MNIGELFVTLGAKTDSSWAEGLNKLKGMGTAAKEAANVAKYAMSNFGAAVKAAALDAELASEKVVSAMEKQAAATEKAARRTASAAGRMSAGRRALADLQGALNGVNENPTASNPRRSVGWGEFMRGLNEQRLAANPDSSSGGNAMSPGEGRLRRFRPVAGASGMFGEGDPFAPPQPGGNGPRTPNRRNPRRNGGGGRGGGGGFSRFGPLGEVSALRRVILGAGIYQSAEQFGQMADVYLSLQNRIRGITSSQSEANATFDRLYEIANRTRTGIEGTAEGYVRMRNATEGMNLSASDQYKLIERVNMALSTSGATASEARSGMMQLTQALAKGTLDGDEFKSLAENMPNILKILQKSLGVTEGRLRAMSRAGELTREKIVKAFLTSDGIEAAFNKTNATFGQTFEIFKNRLIKAFGELAADKDLVRSFAQVMSTLADILIVVAQVLGKIVDLIGPFFAALKEGKPWAFALAGALGILATAWWSVARAAAAAAAAQAAAGAEGGAGAGGLASANGVLKGGSKLAKGIGAASGIAMYASSQGESTGGVLGRLGGATITGGSLAGPWGALAGFLAGIGGEMARSKDLTPDQAMAASSVLKNGGGLLEAAQAAANVSIGPTTVNIYATDAKDAKEQFDQEMIDRTMRHAAAAVNRSGS